MNPSGASHPLLVILVLRICLLAIFQSKNTWTCAKHTDMRETHGHARNTRTRARTHGHACHTWTCTLAHVHSMVTWPFCSNTDMCSKHSRGILTFLYPHYLL